MKNITKDNKGITLLALILTIIVMLILASVTTYTGIDIYRQTQVNKFVTQMQLLQTKVDDLVASKTLEELNNMGLSEPTIEQQNIINISFSNNEITNNTDTYKVFTKDDVLNILDVEDMQNDILVNLETREIVDAVGVKYKGKIYYTQYKLPGGQTIIYDNVETVRDLNYNLKISVEGLNAKLTISNIKITNGSLSYKEENSNYWTSITNYTENGKKYIANISKSGNYIFKLQDNIDSSNIEEMDISITVTNKPKTNSEVEDYNYALDSEKWAYAQKDDVYYVWIPRFAYKLNEEKNTTESKFIKGNSNISTDNTYIDDTWNIHDKFVTDKGIELTGIWVKVDSINQTGLDMIQLLDSEADTLIQI